MLSSLKIPQPKHGSGDSKLGYRLIKSFDSLRFGKSSIPLTFRIESRKVAGNEGGKATEG